MRRWRWRWRFKVMKPKEKEIRGADGVLGKKTRKKKEKRRGRGC